MVIDYKELGHRIAARRKALGLKQFEVCEKADMNPKYLSCIETARSVPSLEVLMKILQVLDLRPNEVLLFKNTYSDELSDDINSINNYDFTYRDTVLNKYESLSQQGKETAAHFIEWLCSNESK